LDEYKEKMGQDLIIICHKCKLITWFSCRFVNINKKDIQEYFFRHKGHDIKVCGDDGGWDLVIGDFKDKGYKSEHTFEWKKQKQE